MQKWCTPPEPCKVSSHLTIMILLTETLLLNKWINKLFYINNNNKKIVYGSKNLLFLKDVPKLPALYTTGWNLFLGQVLEWPLLFWEKSSNSKAWCLNICCIPHNYTGDFMKNWCLTLPPKSLLPLADLVSVQLVYEMGHYKDLCCGAFQNSANYFHLYDSCLSKSNQFSATLLKIEFFLPKNYGWN